MEQYSDYWQQYHKCNTLSDNEKKYRNWMNRVESEVHANIYMNLCDLPDEYYRDSYDFGITPHNMAMTVLEHYYAEFELF